MNLRKSFGFLERFGEPMALYFGGGEGKMQLQDVKLHGRV